MDFITLSNLSSTKLIKDTLVHPLKINRDASGILVETLRKDWKNIYGPGREFAMQYYSVTDSGVARDEDVWHYHPTVQEDRFLVVQGEIIVAVADKREGSSTNGLLNLFYMQADKDPYILLVPKKTLHTFMVVSKKPAIILNYATKLYNPAEEGRIPFEEAGVKLADEELFTWEKARREFPKFYSSINAQH
ncbi:MAG: dTDP-4-dehydrorhamnose 3,5-epimerase family protein [Candidatus Levybacteria bacterium]|nr:dTDP-4-dehydrorhamnose 3,5-epimerase family protein [Candidatus Levybacteria bacterium]